MRGYLTKIIERRVRRLALGAMFGVAIGTTGTVATEGIDDRGFDGADLAAARAQILLTGVCGAPAEGSSGACEKRLQKALVLIAHVRATINKAATTAAGSS
jgi:hypothetical protein